MDAAHTKLNRIVLFLATAMLLAVPAFAADTLNVDVNPVNLGSGSCNNFQFINVTTTSATAVQFSVSVLYQAGDLHGQWLGVSDGFHTAVGGPLPGGITSDPTSYTDTVQPSPGVVALKIVLQSSFIVPDTAKVVLHATNAALNIPDVVIQVNFSPSSTCGGNGGTGSITNNVIQITPGSLPNMTASQGNFVSTQLTVQNLTNATVSFTATTPAGDAWLSTNATGTTQVAAGSQVSVTVTANSGTLGTGTLNSQITFISSPGTSLQLPVTFAITSGSGTGGPGTLTVNNTATTTLNFNYINSGPAGTGLPGPVCVNIQDSSASVTSYSYNITTSSGGSWLRVNNSDVTSQTNQSFAGACLLVQGNSLVQSLATGVYTGTINLTASDNSTATVNINLNISSGSPAGVTVQPGLIYTFTGVTAGATATQQQQFVISGATGVTLGAVTQVSGSGWFSMTAPSNTGSTETFTVVANPTGLAAGIYSAVLTFPVTGSSTGNTNILIVFPVGQNNGGNPGGGFTSVVVPTSLAFATQVGNNYWTGGGAGQNITISGQAGAAWSASANYTSGTGWLLFVAQGIFDSNGLANLHVDISPSNLTAATNPYSATLNVVTPSGTVPVSVTLLVSSQPVLIASPASTVFTSDNGSAPAAQSVMIAGTDTFAGYPIAQSANPVISASTSTTWLSVSVTANKVTLTASASNLATGLYTGTVTITSSNYANSPMSYPVVFIVNGGTAATGTLNFNPSTPLTFNAIAGGAAPAAQTLGVTATTSTSVSVAASEQSCTNVTWLSINPTTNFTASGVVYNLAVSTNAGGLAAGTTCAGTLTFNTSAGQQTVAVNLVVSAAGGSGNVTVTNAAGTANPSLTFSFTTGQSNPPTQSLHVVNTASGTAQTPYTVAVSVQTGSALWLSTNVTSGQTPGDIVVSVNPLNLNAGSTYQGSVTITPTGGTAVVVPVSFTINGQPTVTASPTSLTFTYSVGGTNPAAQNVQVSGGGSAANFSATAVSTGNWLVVSPTTGTTPTSGTYPLSVSINSTILATLNAGDYNGTVTVAGTGGANGNTIVNVKLTVSAPLPTITKVTNAASFSTGPVAPGEIISIFADIAHPIGPVTGIALTQGLIVNNQLPTLMGGVEVIFLPIGKSAPLTYVSATQINCVVPYEAAGVVNLQVEVKYLGQASNAFLLQTAATAPGIFTLNSTGSGPAAIPASYDVAGNFIGANSTSNPVPRGGIITFYVTGEGFTTAGYVTGRVTPSSPLTTPLLPPSVLIDGQPATIFVYGGVPAYAEAPGFVAGLMQISVVIPSNSNTGLVFMSVALGGVPSQVGVQVAVK